MLAIGVVPLIVVRSSARTDSLLVPLAGSLALAAICTAVVAWLTAIVLSGLVVMVLYRTRPKAASRLVLNTVVDSFGRVEGHHRPDRAAGDRGRVAVAGHRAAEPARRRVRRDRAR